jgi:hypothetical protein
VLLALVFGFLAFVFAVMAASADGTPDDQR